MSFYFTSFLALSSCRPLGMEEGRIPWTAVHEYAARLQIEDDEFEDLWIAVSALDAEYLKYRKRKAANKAG